MTTKVKRSVAALLVESMAQAVAIEAGTLAPARRHRHTVREATVDPRPDTPPPESAASGKASASRNPSSPRH